MSHHKRSTWRATRISYRTIERLYGSNADNAGDDICETLQLVSEYPAQYKYRFDSDTADLNPWHHTMIFEIEGISDSAYELFLKMLVARGLIEASSPA